jgi:hypothetical protein
MNSSAKSEETPQISHISTNVWLLRVCLKVAKLSTAPVMDVIKIVPNESDICSDALCLA